MEQKDLQVFSFEGKQTRIVMVDGAPWWVGKDVCDVLGYTNASKAIEDHCKHKGNFYVTNRYGALDPKTGENKTSMVIIPESDVYRLIIRSHMPAAARFEAWVMEEVLPSIRKHGMYMTPQKVNEAALNPDMMTTLVQALKEEQDALKEEREKVSALETQIEEQESLVSFAESLQDDLDNQNTILIGDFRKVLREGNMVFVWLHPSSEVKGIVPLSATVKEVGEPYRLSLTYGGTQ